MKKLMTLLMALAVTVSMIGALMCAVAPYEASAKTVSVSSFSPGDKEIGQFDAGKPVYVEIFNGLPATGTVTLYRVSGDYTNTVQSFALTSGAYAGGVASTNYFLRGDRLLQGGSVTSSTVRVLFEAD